jgi:hypothetical protein
VELADLRAFAFFPVLIECRYPGRLRRPQDGFSDCFPHLEAHGEPEAALPQCIDEGVAPTGGVRPGQDWLAFSVCGRNLSKRFI